MNDLESLSDMIKELDMKGDENPLPLDFFMRSTNTDDYYGPLIYAITNVEDPVHQILVIKYLFSKGAADETRTDSLGRNALAIACTLGYKNTVHLLLNDYNSDVFCVDDSGCTSLMLACESGYDNIIKVLLDHVKCLHGYRGVIKFLDAQNKKGETSFSLSLKHKQLDCANVLSDYLKWALETSERLEAEKLSVNSGKVLKHRRNSNVQTSMSMQLQLPPTPSNMSRRSSTSSSMISTDRTSVPDLSQLKDYCIDNSNRLSNNRISGSYSYNNLHNNPNIVHTTANISIQVGVQFSSSSMDYHHDDDLYNRHHASHVMHMMNENQNVRRHYKVRRLFRVDSGGSPSTDDACSSPEIGRSPTLANRFKRLLDRRTQYASGQSLVGRYSYEPVAKSESSSETEIELITELSGKKLSNKQPVVRSKSNCLQSTSKYEECSPMKEKFKLPPLKQSERLNLRAKF